MTEIADRQARPSAGTTADSARGRRGPDTLRLFAWGMAPFAVCLGAPLSRTYWSQLVAERHGRPGADDRRGALS